MRARLRVCLSFSAVLLALPCSTARADVVINGLDDDLRANVQSLMRLDDQPCDVPARRIEAELDRAHEAVRTGLEAFGYYEPEVSSELEILDECWRVTFAVAVGERVLLRNVDIDIRGSAATDATFAALIRESRIASMMPLLHGNYDALKQALRTLAIERGYRDAQFIESTIDVYPDQHVADLRIVFDSGERYRFGEIELVQDVVSNELLNGYVEAARGEFYDSRRLAEARLELIDSGYFSTVSIDPGVPDSQARVIPVRIRLAPAARAQVNYGFGFS
ncbi:MAG TPA: POTRA domain-containing protein, partial [Gammaproteobacteria bacterium]|nr:POTRA domain-containing protein [Gammaproteobacteria bacterium]